MKITLFPDIKYTNNDNNTSIFNVYDNSNAISAANSNNSNRNTLNPTLKLQL